MIIIKVSTEIIKELALLGKYEVAFELLEDRVRIIFKTNIGSISGDREDVPISEIGNIDYYFKKIIKRAFAMQEALRKYREEKNREE